jgi:hypothetical protein
MEVLASRCRVDRIAVVATEYGDDARRAIDNEGEHVQNIAAEDAHIEGIGIGAGGELPAKQDLLPIATLHTQLCIHGNRSDNSSHATNVSVGFHRHKLAAIEILGAQYGAIRARINEKFYLAPAVIPSENFASNNRTSAPV